MMRSANEKKSYIGYVLLAVIVIVLCWLLLESGQRTKQIDHILKQTVTNN